MTNTLVIALFVEGRTDERFLPVLIQRETESLLLRYSHKVVDVLEPILVEPSEECRSNADRLLDLAKQTEGFHLLIVHSDADYPSAERALAERFQPGLDLIIEAKNNGVPVCEEILPVIPIRMIESWMIADVSTFHSVIGTRIPVSELELPQHPHQVESIANPKQALIQAISKALADRPRRRRDPQKELVILQETLARQIRLDELRRVPAFRVFENDLQISLRSLHLID